MMPGKRVQFDDATWAQIDLLARENGQPFQELADEAFADLLAKYDRSVDLKAQLMKSAGEASAPTVAQQLAHIEHKLARKIPAKPSPEKGVALMRRGLAEVQHRALTEKSRADQSGRKTASEPKGEARPRTVRGKNGSAVQDGSLTRSAIVSAASQPKRKKRDRR